MQTHRSEEPQGAPRNVFTWIVTVLVCLYLGWNGVVLYFSTGQFASLYESLNAPMPWSTDFLVHHYRWLYPCLFGAAGSLAITQQFFARSKMINVCISLAVAVVFGTILSQEVVRVLYAPLKVMEERLK